MTVSSFDVYRRNSSIETNGIHLVADANADGQCEWPLRCLFSCMCNLMTSNSMKILSSDFALHRELFYLCLETIRAIIRLNSRYCFPIVNFR